MPDNYQFSSEHYFYIAHNAGVPQALTGIYGDSTVHYNNAAWAEYGNIRDLSESQNNNQVNITTRADARQGLSVNVIATTEASATVEIRYKPNDPTTGLAQDQIYRALLVASRTKSDIAIVDLDRPMTSIGAQGLVGNWNVAMSRSKPVEGIVTATVNLNLSTLGDFIVASNATGTAFEYMDSSGAIVPQIALEP